VLEGAVMTFWPRCRTCGWRGGMFEDSVGAERMAAEHLTDASYNFDRSGQRVKIDITQVGREAYALLALPILAVLLVGMLR
jgi:hypothetical protein